MQMAGIIMFICEMYWVRQLEKKYGIPFGDDVAHFMSKATLEDIYRMICHVRMAGLGLMIATMGRLFHV